MTDQQHPITPPPELVCKWASSMCGYYEAARWGADQELEVCCEWIGSEGLAGYTSRELRAARRPKPPSLKEQALAIVCRGNQALTTEEQVTIRRALEQLDD